ncbi:receptor-like protein EIX1 [Pistacia vera]|uniref:receptor-like protein EIX1 n=1 Tax=Pistacia vera TaxID=55513 RepID=UPI001263A514|nr:receptor-like protein EIX1 [Pistacia vera]
MSARLFLELLAIATIKISFCYGSYVGCIENERQALLRFKQDLKDPSNRLVSWRSRDGDCCTWDGVVCDNFTGHVLELHLGNPIELYSHGSEVSYRVESMLKDSAKAYDAYERAKLSGKINPSLLNLKHLVFLDLSNNNFDEEIQVPRFLGSMGNLRYLDLSGVGFRGSVPHDLGNLSNLQYLYLGINRLHAENLGWLSGLSFLKHLDLSLMDLYEVSDWLSVINALPSLMELKLSFCSLFQLTPVPLANLSSLTTLDLSFNHNPNNLIFGWVSGLRNLVFLDLSENQFKGSLPHELQNLTSLKHLDLSSNQLNSSIPDWLYRNSHLEFLSLGGNNLEGTISGALGNLTSLASLDVSSNKLEGNISRSWERLCNLNAIDLFDVKLSQEIREVLNIFSGCVSGVLEYLNLENTNLFGRLTEQLGQFKNLKYLDLKYNSLSGSVPVSIGELSFLRFLDLSNNKLEGVVSEIHFANLTRLLSFGIFGNSLMLKVSPDWIPPFQIRRLVLGYCHLGPSFPLWLHSQKYLVSLDISNSGIVDKIPNWFWTSDFRIPYLNLSHNQIYGEIPNLTEAHRYVDLSSNNLSGLLPLVSSNMTLLDLSNNALSGSIFHFSCHERNESKEMKILKLKDNLLSGELPDCWMNWQALRMLNLDNNNFTGNLPSSIGSLSLLQSLHLRKNNLSGILPTSIKNCTSLMTFDVAENWFVGNIPIWIGQELSYMVMLNLRSNKFDGHLPTELCYLTFLHVLDLAYNNLSRTIPSCIKNLSAMVSIYYDEANYISYGSEASSFFEIVYCEDAVLVTKGKAIEYNNILNLVRSIDLSGNIFSGVIANEVTNLKALQSLNLSYNSFSGRIPETIGAMTSLESLDFSANQLTGEIPQVISGLTFLSHLNLSNNNLTGKIPTGTQLQSFDASSFVGNDLCGSPLPKNCTSIVLTPAHDHSGRKNGNEHEVNWFYVGMALGFVVGFWSIIGPLLVNRRWRYLYLFRAGYGGNVPHNIGNILSNLQYLDLGNNSNIRAENLGWLSGLSLLKYFDLSFMVSRSL